MKILSKLKKGFVRYAKKRGNKMTDKFTDKEIIKALECCADLFDCISCPCKDFCGDLGKLQQNALDLINRQQARIKELEERCNNK